MKKLYMLLIMAVWVTVGYALYWPIVYGNYEEQRITANFGEYRSTGTHHFHDGVDLVPYAGAVIGTWVWGVENEYIWQISESGHYIKTWWHDYHHINPDDGLDPGDPVDPTCVIGEIDNSYNPPHLHWNARTLAWAPVSYATHPIHPYQSIWYRLDPLMWDFYDPIIHDVIFTDDGNYLTTHDPNQLPANTNIDIVVKATDWHPHHGTGGYDENNGVYMVGYNIDAPPTQFNIKFDYFETIGDWNLNCVYDNIHSSTFQYWYVVTNTMTQNGYWNTGSPGAHQVYIRVEDEWGSFDQTIINIYVTTGIEENTIEPVYTTCLNAISPNPVRDKIRLNYQIANPTATKITIFDCSGRIVKSIVINDDSGNHTVIWDGADAQGREVTNGCYFVKFEAGDYKVTKKFILVK